MGIGLPRRIGSNVNSVISPYPRITKLANLWSQVVDPGRSYLEVIFGVSQHPQNMESE
jgi:hypothetical protein